MTAPVSLWALESCQDTADGRTGEQAAPGEAGSVPAPE